MNPPVTITLSKLRIYAHHGVLAQERTVGNWFEVTVSVTFPCTAVESDNIDSTINYAFLAGLIRQEMAKPSNLIENVAGRIARSIHTEIPEITEGTVTVTKITPPILGIQCAGASVTLRF